MNAEATKRSDKLSSDKLPMFLRGVLLLALFLSFEPPIAVAHANTLSPLQEQEMQLKAMRYLSGLWQKAMELPPGSRDRLETLGQLLQLQPQHVETRMQLGLETMHTPQGVKLLEDCFNKSVVGETSTIDQINVDHAWRIANFIGRYHQNSKHYAKAQEYFEMAIKLSQEVHHRRSHGDVCTALQLATHLDAFPLSTADADMALETMNTNAQQFLSLPSGDKRMNDKFISDSLPNAEPDPYDHCLLTNFLLSFYYRADVARVSQQHYQLTAAAWPDLIQVAPHVQQFEREKKPLENGSIPIDHGKTCVSSTDGKRIKLGVISGTLSHAHPVTEDFSGILTRLNRNLFEVTYVYLDETGTPPAAFIFEKHRDKSRNSEFTDGYIHLAKNPNDTRNSTWVRRYAMPIMELELDMILYLDMTMSTQARRLGMQRLAPVQLNTHGHPVTSGHPRSLVQYFISWAEAELGLEESQSHYTEELLLIPNGTLHQYYTPRVLPDQTSRLDGMPFSHLTRVDFGLPTDENIRLYLNMQKPFKLHPEYDPLVCGILSKDPEGHIILHKTESPDGHQVFVTRLENAGCDLHRIHFLPVQHHHRLLRLYQLATVILDSYPAGGCTTTREVLELGKAVVTLPARLLGGRWTLGLYNTLLSDDNGNAANNTIIKEAVIASNPKQFVDKAVALATNDSLRMRVEEGIAAAVPLLFHRTEAVRAWEDILLRASPVAFCDALEDSPKEEL